MNLKSVFQIILLFTIFTISGIFYYNFFATKDKKVELITENKEQLSSKLEDKIESELINIEYNSSDSEGNTFYINAERAMISKKDTKNNNINLEGVISIINLKNRGIINIYSKNAIYNKQNNNTLFFNDVKIEYLDNTIYSQNLDFIFTEKISKVYNNVVYKNNNLNLTTDKILIDMKTGDVKLEMINNYEKVKLVANYELIN
tara:strand:- start:2232 stop:2840 length:609 start_codon:yes stop_codon:yes gene_type:complete